MLILRFILTRLIYFPYMEYYILGIWFCVHYILNHLTPKFKL